MAEMFAFDAHESVSQDENPVQSALCVMENLIEDGDKDFLLSLIAEKLDGEKQRTLLSALQSEAAGVLADSSPLGKSDSQPKISERARQTAAEGKSWADPSFKKDGRWWALYGSPAGETPPDNTRRLLFSDEDSPTGLQVPRSSDDVSPMVSKGTGSGSGEAFMSEHLGQGALPSSALRCPTGGKRAFVHVVVPSLSVDQEELEKIEGEVHYEERQLFWLMNLRDPLVHLTYMTSVPIHPSIVAYYLSLIPEDADRASIHSRLSLLSVFDASKRPLSQKILLRPRMQRKLQNIISSGFSRLSAQGIPEEEIDCRLNSFIPTLLENKLAQELKVKIAAPPFGDDVQFWGTKPGSRQIFEECGIPYPKGVNVAIYTVEELADHILRMWTDNPSLKAVVVKLSEGFSGKGNAILDLKAVSGQLYSNYRFSPTRKGVKMSDKEKILAIKRELRSMRFQGETETWDHFSKRIPVLGCIVEEFLTGLGKQSPSCQAIIEEDGSVRILSTHEQVLGGRDGQVYLGCRFPCDEPYRKRIQEMTMEVGKRLASKGASERFGVDFLAVPSKPWDFSEWQLYALEINLRQGGTTHPYETLRLTTWDGHFDPSTGLYMAGKDSAGNPQAKYYIASDNVEDERYKGLLPSDLLTIMKENGIGFSHTTRTGAIFHMMGAISQFGKFGVTCIGNSYEEAEELYESIVEVLERETRVVK